MRAYTISKLLTIRNIVTNVPQVLQPMNYHQALQESNQYLLSGDKKRAIEAFKNVVSGDKIKAEDVANATKQEIIAELEWK